MPLLNELRKIPGLTETKPGIFYVKRLPMLHFHQTDEGIVADLKAVVPRSAGFDRFAVDKPAARHTLLRETAARCQWLQEKKRP